MLPLSTCPAIFAGGDTSRRSSMAPTTNMIAAGEQQAERLGVVGEDLVELVELRRHGHRDEEPDEHRRAAERRRGLGVHAARARHRDRADAGRDPAHHERQEERDDRGDPGDGQVPGTSRFTA